MQAKYNTLINSDIVLRSFIINIRGKQYEAFILYDLLNESIVAELPIEKFGILSSALLAYDGVLFSLFEVTSEKNMESLS